MSAFAFKEALEKAVGDPELSDVILEVKDDNDNTSDGEVQEIHASKFVLSARSEVFRRMLSENSFKEGQTKRVVCSGFNAATMKSLIHYLYTEEIISFRNNGTNDSSEETTPTSNKDMENFHELTDLYNAGHYYFIQDLMGRIAERAKQSQLWKNKEAIPSLLYAACNIYIVEFETSNFFDFIQSCIQQHIFDQTITLGILKDSIGANHLHRVINGTTTLTSKDKCYYWLKLLKEWASKSDEHALAAQDVMKKISCTNLNVHDLNAIYTEDKIIMTADVACEKFRTLALLSNEELDRVLKELKNYSNELSTCDHDISRRDVKQRINRIVENKPFINVHILWESWRLAFRRAEE